MTGRGRRVADVRIHCALRVGGTRESALRAVRTARFSPVQKNGRPVRVLMLIEGVYDWEERQR